MNKQRTTTIIGATLALVAVGALALSNQFAGTGQAQSGAGNDPIVLTVPTYEPTPTVAPAPPVAPALASTPEVSLGFDNERDLNSLLIVDLDPVLSESRARWRVREGLLEQNATEAAGNPGTQRTAALVADQKWDELTISTSFYDQYNGVSGLITHYDGNDSYYLYTIIADRYQEGQRQVLEKVTEGVVTVLAQSDLGGFDAREWNTISLEVVNGALTVSLNGDVVLEATDTRPLSAGAAGVHSRAFGGMLFDNLVVVTP